MGRAISLSPAGAFGAALVPALALAAFVLVDRVHDNPTLFRAFGGAALALGAWNLVLLAASQRGGRRRTLEIAPRAQAIDRAARSAVLRRFDPAALGRALAPRRRYLAYMWVWAVVFAGGERGRRRRGSASRAVGAVLAAGLRERAAACLRLPGREAVGAVQHGFGMGVQRGRDPAGGA